MQMLGVTSSRHGRQWLSFAGIRLERVLSLDLFREEAGLPEQAPWQVVAACCQSRWTDLANSVAAAPTPMELCLTLGVCSEPGQPRRSVEFTFLAMGRGASAAQAEERARHSAATLWVLLTTTMDYAEFRCIDTEEGVRRAVARLSAPHVAEVRRRLERVVVSHGSVQRQVVGFLAEESLGAGTKRGRRQEEVRLLHLFPWVPSDDSWHRLYDVMAVSPHPAALAIHLRGFSRVPRTCEVALRDQRVAAEQVASAATSGSGGVNVLGLQVETLRIEAARRSAVLASGVLAARVFLLSDGVPMDALVATAIGSVDDASAGPGQAGTENALRGGGRLADARSEDVLESLDEPSLDLLFGAVEAPSVLRTPMPSRQDYPGLPINRARTAPLVGCSGNDVPLGANAHRGSVQPVALDDVARQRHVYVVGQTGSGKSTMLLHMVLHDLQCGRGVGVLDPHGTLIQEILLRIPENRVNDVVLVDVTDVERPVGFNILCLRDVDPLNYRQARDQLIDDLYSYIGRLYDLRLTGGPMFEMYFRGMMALLMGTTARPEEATPNVMIFKRLFTDRSFRRRLARRSDGTDQVAEDFVREAEATTGDAALANLSPYVTSKLSRFVSDYALRNITCQNRILDIDAVVREGKILLFYLGRGRFGEFSAGLLASQVVSRVWSAAVRRGADSGRPFCLYADEFQLFADERFSDLLAEARKFGLWLTLAHQYVEQIPREVLTAVLGNVGTMIVQRVGARDAEVLAPLFRPVFGKEDLSSQPNFAACVRSLGSLGQVPFSVEIPPPPEATDVDRAKRAADLSRGRYGRDRAEVEAEIQKTYRCFPKTWAEAAADEAAAALADGGAGDSGG